IEFVVNEDAASAQENRFILVFKPTVILPVSWVKVQANRESNQQIEIRWQVANEQSVAAYRVFRSEDGNRFQPIGTVEASTSTAAMKEYHYRDTDQSGQSFFYRIQSVDLDGKTSFSEIVSVSGKKLASGYRLIQNMVQNQSLSIEAMQQAAGKISIDLFQFNGQKLASYSESLNGQMQEMIYMNLPASLANGKYFVRITDSQNKVYVLEFIIP
ncbi:MAG TPA: hypothetical protein PKK69_10910, partial [Ferruginibacter sp.]|nr:hypothetical protein [Ferruginibacter sp.]